MSASPAILGGTPAITCDHEKVCRLERLVQEKLGFDESYAVTGQT